jgi:hypothetical protein
MAEPFDREYVWSYLDEVLNTCTGNVDPEVRRFMQWFANYEPKYTAEQRAALAKLVPQGFDQGGVAQ